MVLAALLTAALLLAACTPPQPTVNSIRFTIEVDGKKIPMEAQTGITVQMALQQANISLGSLDRVEPPSYSILLDGDSIEITRVREVFTVEENIIPFDRQTVRNESLPDGQTLLVQQGVNGVEQITYRQVFENDVEVSNTVFKSEVLVEPLSEIMMVGVQKPFTPVTIPGRLAYLSGGNAWLMETSTGNRRPIVTTGDLDGYIFSVSPKGDWLLFTRAERTDADTTDGSDAENNGVPEKFNSLWAVDLNEKEARPVYLKVDNVIHFAGWVPGKGLTITYSTVEPRSTEPGWQANNDLYQLTFSATGATSKPEKIIETNAGGVYGWWGTSFAWSPDGTYLAYSRPDSVGLVDFDKNELVPLVDLLPFQTGSSWAWVPGISWSPDGKILYLVTHAPKAGLESEEASPWFDLSALPIGEDPFGSDDAPPSNGPLINLIQKTGMFAYPVASKVAWGQSYPVAFLQAIVPEQSDTKRYRLTVMDRDGSNQQVIFPPPDHQGLDAQQIAWSPDVLPNGNLWIAVQYQGNLWLVDSQTGESQQITGDGLITRYDWK